jgi:hypothetical protein
LQKALRRQSAIDQSGMTNEMMLAAGESSVTPSGVIASVIG